MGKCIVSIGKSCWNHLSRTNIHYQLGLQGIPGNPNPLLYHRNQLLPFCMQEPDTWCGRRTEGKLGRNLTHLLIRKIMINHGNYIKIIQNQHLAFVKLNVVPRNGVPLYASFTLSPSLSLSFSPSPSDQLFYYWIRSFGDSIWNYKCVGCNKPGTLWYWYPWTGVHARSSVKHPFLEWGI